MTFGTPIPPPQPSIATVLSGGGQTGTHITVPEGTAVTDTAVITAPSGQPISGRVTYAAYPSSFCFGKSIKGLGPGGATTGTGPSSNAVVLPMGTYYFQAFYSGNGVLNRAATPCGAEVLTVGAKTPTTPPPRVFKPPVALHPILVLFEGELEGEWEFPEPGEAEWEAEVVEGGELFGPNGELADFPRTSGLAFESFATAAKAKHKKCKKGFVRKGKKCVNNAPVKYGRAHLTVTTPGHYKLRIKPNKRVLNALKKRGKLRVRTTLVFTPTGAPTTHIVQTASTTVHIKKKKKKTKKHHHK
jgi:hypothetical protein